MKPGIIADWIDTSAGIVDKPHQYGGGLLQVSSGSQIALLGTIYGLEIPTFNSCPDSETTEAGVESDQVPEVVGTAIVGMTGAGT